MTCGVVTVSRLSKNSQCHHSSPSQDYTHPDDHNLPTYGMTPGFKPFTVLNKFTL